MLIPRKRFVTETIDGQDYCSYKYSVYDTDECGFIENKFLTIFNTEEECQKAIDEFNSFHIVQTA